LSRARFARLNPVVTETSLLFIHIHSLARNSKNSKKNSKPNRFTHARARPDDVSRTRESERTAREHVMRTAVIPRTSTSSPAMTTTTTTSSRTARWTPSASRAGDRRPTTPARRSVVAGAKKKSKKDVQMSEAAWFLDQFKYQQRYKAQTNVFSMETSELPGGDKLTPEGVAVGLLFGFLALWLGSVSIKLISVTWALIWTTLKYSAIAGVLLLLGILAS
jgi:hypothetical protein